MRFQRNASMSAATAASSWRYSTTDNNCFCIQFSTCWAVPLSVKLIILTPWLHRHLHDNVPQILMSVVKHIKSYKTSFHIFVTLNLPSKLTVLDEQSFSTVSTNTLSSCCFSNTNRRSLLVCDSIWSHNTQQSLHSKRQHNTSPRQWGGHLRKTKMLQGSGK